MDDKIWPVLEILTDYDRTLGIMLLAANRITQDTQCDNQTAGMAEGLLIAVMLDKAAPLVPENARLQEEVMRAAPGLFSVLDRLSEPLPLLHQVAIGYTLALSQGRWAWRPWERVRDHIVEHWPLDNQPPECTVPSTSQEVGLDATEVD